MFKIIAIIIIITKGKRSDLFHGILSILIKLSEAIQVEKGRLLYFGGDSRERNFEK